MRSRRVGPRMALVAALAMIPSPAGAAGEEPAVRLAVVVDGHAPVARGHAPAMVAEADAIWRPHGVAVALLAAGEVAAGWVRMTVAFEPTGARTGHDPGLGSIWFAEDGQPAPTIRVDEAAVAARVRGDRVNGRLLDSLPPAMAQRITGRALGRVLAHEIGHFLLASPAHSPTGLMRPSFSGRQLSEWHHQSFALDARVLPRLRAKLARLDAGPEPAGR